LECELLAAVPEVGGVASFEAGTEGSSRSCFGGAGSVFITLFESQISGITRAALTTPAFFQARIALPGEFFFPEGILAGLVSIEFLLVRP
jgi:hypothetical protein